MTRQAILRILLALLLLASQQLASMHVLSHLGGAIGKPAASQSLTQDRLADVFAQDEACSHCLAFAHLTRRFTGTDALDISHSVSKGSSFVEPGITPGQDMTLRWSNLTDFARDCGESRLWGGQNFRASIEAAAQYAPQIGDLAYEYVQRKVNGG